MQPGLSRQFCYRADSRRPLEYSLESFGFMEKRSPLAKMVVYYFHTRKHGRIVGNFLSLRTAKDKEK